jgi:hypothetical protein
MWLCRRILIPAFLVIGSAAPAPAEPGRLADDQVAAWVRQRVADWQPTAEDRRFDEIAWAPDIRKALALGKEHHRPIFLFTHDGRMAVGRC